MKINYANKTGTITPNLPDYQVWKDDDANHVKDVVNTNDTQVQNMSESTLITNSIRFSNISGQLVNSAHSPMSGSIPVNLDGAVNGSVAGVWYKGSIINDNTFSGVDVVFMTGENLSNELCIVWLIYDSRSGGIITNIQVGNYIPATIPSAPTNLQLIEGIYNVVAPPTDLILTRGNF